MHLKTIEEFQFVPYKALVFYKKERGYYPNENYLEVGDINSEGIKNLRPVTKHQAKQISSVMDSVVKKENKYNPYQFSSFINRNILHFKTKNKDSFDLVWTIPAHKNTFILNKKKGTLNYPNLLFIVSNSKFVIFTYKGGISENTILYKAPFPNIYREGSMCFGNMNFNKLLSKDLSKVIVNFEDSFFNSSFNSLEAENVSRGNTFNLLNKLMDSDKKFIMRELVKTKLRIKDVIPK